MYLTFGALNLQVSTVKGQSSNSRLPLASHNTGKQSKGSPRPGTNHATARHLCNRGKINQKYSCQGVPLA